MVQIHSPRPIFSITYTTHASLQIGSIGSNICLEQPYFRRYLLSKSGADVGVAGCCPQTGMPNPLFHQVSGDTLFLKNGHPAVTKSMESTSRPLPSDVWS